MGLSRRLAEILQAAAPPGLSLHHQPMPEVAHATIHHPAALTAFRAAFGPERESD